MVRLTLVTAILKMFLNFYFHAEKILVLDDKTTRYTEKIRHYIESLVKIKHMILLNNVDIKKMLKHINGTLPP